VVIVAAGRGTRVGGPVPKQWRDLSGRPVAEHAMRAFASHPAVGQLVLVMHPDDMQGSLWPRHPAATTVPGGQTRCASVLAGLEALDGQADIVLIHDAARPLVSTKVISTVLAALQTARAAAPAVAVSDALWHGSDGHVTGTQDRAGLFRAQTPQGFWLADILAAHRSYRGAYAAEAADDVAVARAAGIAVAIVPGDDDNLKITQEADFARAARVLEGQMDIRVGNGFDVHRFEPGDHVWLCGVRIPFTQGLNGHSDADVGLHAVTDAIYGALAMGDIGQHFPPSDPQWKGAASHVFLSHAVQMARETGFVLTHVDCTLICELPKIGPHAGAMRTTMAGILGIDSDRVSVKATTSEKLGFTGRGEGIAAMATATLVKS
jgi:2-C-methyl-D-erythritol 4-phosphate cytidylyltransferase / 2-C-methyl-D-erythritol 2,4-cyclodiphosphate synthase